MAKKLTKKPIKKVVKKVKPKVVKKIKPKVIKKVKPKTVKKTIKKIVKKAVKPAVKKAVKKIVKKTVKPQPKKKVNVKTAKKAEEKVFKPVRKVRKNVKMKYTSLELQQFKEILLAERRSILESARANMKSLVDDESGDYVGENLTYSTHMAEQGTDEMEREKNYMFVQRDEKYLGYIQEALTRIDQGTYGICIDCLDEPKFYCKTCPLIPKERLELVPITQHCIECKKLRG